MEDTFLFSEYSNGNVIVVPTASAAPLAISFYCCPLKLFEPKN